MSYITSVDNSEFMRNGDFIPSRLQAQQEAVSLVCHAKLRSNPENNIALLTMAGNPQVLTTLTSDVGRVLSKLHQIQILGETNILTGIKIAHLTLKHRQGKNHKMRIVAFIGSPVQSDEKELIKIAKKLKKEKVNVDIINFGEEIINTDKLYSFIKILDGTSSHMVTVPSGSPLSDALYSSPVILGEDGSGAPNLGSSGFEFGFDPNDDPELALALRVSMEEQRQRQEEEARQTTTGSVANPNSSLEAGSSSSSSITPAATTPMESQPAQASTEEEMLEKALAMSLEPMSSESSVDIYQMTEDEQIQYAMQMSLQASNNEDGKESKTDTKEEPMETDDSDEKK
ncbi:hypothetical protein NH340_JMT06264 [Sarcoptes scabiei]|uniref:26S proteasome non-ATPase regulatory subunit 4 n=1 Tax=Sarcoptes scabiei TaxID=52283 RepID=A0A131ZU30_SARSC|nr:26S proteasome non-ATPase regulatory subunit 4-like protein [Sarcoptes scabiei]UXI20321.1 hypothetical protein NH340_JMT06264 [Sarcoptes scabiei]